MAGKRVAVVEETETGRNQRYKDTHSGEQMSRSDFVRRIEQGQYPHYHVREVNGVKTPCSNPDDSQGNNLG